MAHWGVWCLCGALIRSSLVWKFYIFVLRGFIARQVFLNSRKCFKIADLKKNALGDKDNPLK